VTPSAVNISSIVAARARGRDYVVKTPLLTNHVLDDALGGRVFIKAESLQRTGSFKFRGAINRLLQLSQNDRRRGVVAFSSGNHALAVAEAARLLDVPAVVIMPKDAPAIKISGARSRKAEVVLYDRMLEDREAITNDIITRRGLILVPPYDDPFVIAGQGVGALEALEQLSGDFGIAQPDQAIICCSGGGLASGWSTSLRASTASVKIFTVEPAGFDDMARSLESGRRETNNAQAQSICDALQVQTPGTLTFPILSALGVKGLVVTDAEVLDAMSFALSALKLVLEPSGAAPLAAMLNRKVDARGGSTLIIASGGNIDPSTLANNLSARVFK
jgi:threonine dehydratase